MLGTLLEETGHEVSSEVKEKKFRKDFILQGLRLGSKVSSVI